MKQLITAAFESERGIVVRCNNIQAFKDQFYKTRKQLIDAGIESAKFLTLRTSPNAADELWIVKKEEPSNGT